MAPPVKYTPEYFIAKFEAIPDEQWCTALFDNGKGAKCVLGHCGFDLGREYSEECSKLGEILLPLSRNHTNLCVLINDSALPTDFHNDLGDTPKERILNALTLVACGLAQEAMP